MRLNALGILLTGMMVAVISSGFFCYPAADPEDEKVQELDGAGTYVDNDALWQSIAGEWSSDDGRWNLTLDGQDCLILRLDGSIAVESTLRFSYLCPEPSRETELTVEIPWMYGRDGTEMGQILSLVHEAGEKSTLKLELLWPEKEREMVMFQKAEK